jgi:hypothetical protein
MCVCVYINIKTRAHTHTTIGTSCALQLTVGWPTVSQLRSTTCTICCIYTVYLLMMGYKYARNM